MLRALGTWLYDGDPFEPLAFDARLAAIKQRLADGENYFESLIQTCPAGEYPPQHGDPGTRPGDEPAAGGG